MNKKTRLGAWFEIVGDLVGSEAHIYCVQALFSFFQLKGDLIILANLIDKSGNMYKILLFGFGFFYKTKSLFR